MSRKLGGHREGRLVCSVNLQTFPFSIWKQELPGAGCSLRIVPGTVPGVQGKELKKPQETGEQRDSDLWDNKSNYHNTERNKGKLKIIHGTEMPDDCSGQDWGRDWSCENFKFPRCVWRDRAVERENWNLLVSSWDIGLCRQILHLRAVKGKGRKKSGKKDRELLLHFLFKEVKKKIIFCGATPG